MMHYCLYCQQFQTGHFICTHSNLVDQNVEAYKQLMYNRLSINEQLNYLRMRSQQSSTIIHFERLIHKQQQVIKSLQSQLLLLKSYITIKGESDQTKQTTSQLVSSKNHQNCPQCQKFILQQISNQSIIQEMGQILQAKNIDRQSVINTIKQLKELVNKQKQPIFVQRIKQIKVPITIQKIIDRPIEKIVQRIVYVDRPTVVFKEKVVEKFIQRKDQPMLNTSHSQKTIKIQRPQKDLDESRNYKYQTNYNRKPQYGSNLIKKRQNASKYYSKY